MSSEFAGGRPADSAPPLQQLPPGLRSIARIVNAPASRVLFRTATKPQSMFYVHRGEALMQRVTPRGAVVILQRGTGCFLGEASLTSERYHCDAVCRTDCVLLVMPILEVRRVIDEDIEARWAWIDRLAAGSRRQRAAIERLALKKVQDRVVHLVLTEGSASGVYEIPGTKLELASELGVTPEALYRTLARMHTDGTLIVSGVRLILAS